MCTDAIDPYGQLLAPISSTSAVSEYRYGGKEWSDVTLSYDFGARNYLPSIPRWTTMDPLAEKYYSISPYVYCAGNLVNLVDEEGKKIVIKDYGEEIINYYWNEIEGQWGFYDLEGNPYNGDNQYIIIVSNSLRQLMKGNNGAAMVKEIVEKEEEIRVSMREKVRNFYSPNQKTISWNPSMSDPDAPFVSLAHELAHALDDLNGTYNGGVWISKQNALYVMDKDVTWAEIVATHFENLIRAEHGYPLRKEYLKDKLGRYMGGKLIDNKGRSLYYNTQGKTNYSIVRSNQRYQYK